MNTTFPDSYYKKVINTLLSQSESCEMNKDPEKVLTNTLELLAHFLNLNNGRIFLWDTQSEKLVIRYSHGLTKQQISLGKYEISEGITGEVLDSGRAILVPNVDEASQFKAKVSSITPADKRAKSYIAVPISSDGVDLGVLAVDCHNTNDGDIEAYSLVLKLVANMLADIIHKYELSEFDLINAA